MVYNGDTLKNIMLQIAIDIYHGYQTGELPSDFTLSDFRDLEYLFWCYNSKYSYYTENKRIADYVIKKGIKVTERNGVYKIHLGGEDDVED